jgi:ATP/ADP translocase
MSHVSRLVSQRVASDDLAFEVSLKVLAVCTTAAGVLICALYGLTQRLHQQDMAGVITATERAANVTNTTSQIGSISAASQQGNEHRSTTTMIATSISPSPQVVRGKKPKLSFAESTRLLLSDPYLRNIATMVLSYGLTMEFTEIIWKSTVKKAFPVKTEYLIFMGRYSTYVGAAAFGMMFVGTSIVQALGWRAGALVTPVTMGLAALPFFASIMRQGEATPQALRQVVYIGLLQNVLSKASKYAVFDPTKEMAYIPLDADSKTKGKAAIDVLGEDICRALTLIDFARLLLYLPADANV